MSPAASALRASQEVQVLDLLLSAADVAEALGISVRTLWRWSRDGITPAPLRLGKKTTRWRASDLQRYIDSRS